MLERANRHLNPDGRIILSYLSAKTPFPTNGIAVMRFAARLMQYEHWFATGDLESEVRSPWLQIVDHRRLPEMPTVVLSR